MSKKKANMINIFLNNIYLKFLCVIRTTVFLLEYQYAYCIYCKHTYAYKIACMQFACMYAYNLHSHTLPGNAATMRCLTYINNTITATHKSIFYHTANQIKSVRVGGWARSGLHGNKQNWICNRKPDSLNPSPLACVRNTFSA